MDLREAHFSNAPVRHPWERARMRIVHDVIEKTMPQHPQRVLDVGCGDVWLIERLSEHLSETDFQAVDIALTEDEVATYNRRFEAEGKTIRVHNSILRSLEAADDPLDLVLLLDVLEHVEDDTQFLQGLIRTHPGITEHTRWLITVPSFQALFCQHDVFLGHYRRYSLRSLNVTLRDAGLKSLRCSYFFSALLLPRYLQMTRERYIKASEQTGIGAWRGGCLLTKILTELLWMDYKIGDILDSAGFRPPGLSVLSISQRAPTFSNHDSR